MYYSEFIHYSEFIPVLVSGVGVLLLICLLGCGLFMAWESKKTEKLRKADHERLLDFVKHVNEQWLSFFRSLVGMEQFECSDAGRACLVFAGPPSREEFLSLLKKHKELRIVYAARQFLEHVNRGEFDGKPQELKDWIERVAQAISNWFANEKKDLDKLDYLVDLAVNLDNSDSTEDLNPQLMVNILPCINDRETTEKIADYLYMRADSYEDNRRYFIYHYLSRILKELGLNDMIRNVPDDPDYTEFVEMQERDGSFRSWSKICLECGGVSPEPKNDGGFMLAPGVLNRCENVTMGYVARCHFLYNAMIIFFV